MAASTTEQMPVVDWVGDWTGESVEDLAGSRQLPMPPKPDDVPLDGPVRDIG